MRKLFFISFCALISTVSCIKSDIIDSTYGEELIGFETHIGRNAVSKATPVTTADLKEFGIYGFYTGRDSYNGTGSANLMDKTPVTKSGNAWTYSPARYWTNGVDNYSFLAYYPLSAANNQNPPYITYTASEDITKQVDLIYSNLSNIQRDGQKGMTVIDGKKYVAFNFKHALSRINFTATSESYEDITFNIKGIKIRGKFYESDTFNIFTEKWTHQSSSLQQNQNADKDMEYSIAVPDGITLSSTPYSFGDKVENNYLMIIPTDLVDGTITVTYTVKYGTVESLPTEKSFTISQEFIAGKSYAINLHFAFDTSNKITFSVSELLNWDGGENEVGEVIDGNSIKLYGSQIENGIYTLRYDNAKAEAVADYADICTLSVSSNEAEYVEFIDANVAPADAASIGVYNSNGKRVGFIPLGSLKKSYGTKLYSFGLLSDIHQDAKNSATAAYSDFTKALQWFSGIDNLRLICNCGDVSESAHNDEAAAEAEYESYVQAIADYSPNIPVYTTTGNHDCTSTGIDVERWKQYTGQDLTFVKSIERADGSKDHFIFFGMSYWNYSVPYELEHIAWLKEQLERYKDERCFVITHLFFPDRAGNLNGLYQSSNWFKDAQLEILEDLCDHYVNTVWFSGHSHWKWEMQRFQDRANIYPTYRKGTPSSGWCVHVPSCAKPRHSPDGAENEGDMYSESQGSVVDVYENCIIIKGVDFITGKYLPIATYCLDTSIYEVGDLEESVDLYLHAADFTPNTDRPGTKYIQDVPDMPNYFDVIFTGTSQGWYATNSTFVSGPEQYVTISVLDVQAFTSSNETYPYEPWEPISIDVVSKVGFYSGAYHISSTNLCDVYPTSGVEFRTSSSCPGPFPLKLRMKVMAQFTEK